MQNHSDLTSTIVAAAVLAAAVLLSPWILRPFDEGSGPHAPALATADSSVHRSAACASAPREPCSTSQTPAPEQGQPRAWTATLNR